MTNNQVTRDQIAEAFAKGGDLGLIHLFNRADRRAWDDRNQPYLDQLVAWACEFLTAERYRRAVQSRPAALLELMCEEEASRERVQAFLDAPDLEALLVLLKEDLEMARELDIGWKTYDFMDAFEAYGSRRKPRHQLPHFDDTDPELIAPFSHDMMSWDDKSMIVYIMDDEGGEDSYEIIPRDFRQEAFLRAEAFARSEFPARDLRIEPEGVGFYEDGDIEEIPEEGYLGAKVLVMYRYKAYRSVHLDGVEIDGDWIDVDDKMLLDVVRQGGEWQVGYYDSGYPANWREDFHAGRYVRC